jgi:hypothetical protein
VTGFVKRAVADRIAGRQPSPFRAIAAATAAGAAAAGITYRALRS